MKIIAKTLVVERGGVATLLPQNVPTAVALSGVTAGTFIDLAAVSESVGEFAGEEDWFSIRDAGRIAGVSYDIATEWVRVHRLLRPTQKGRGCRPGKYHRMELFVAAILGHLHRHGHAPQAMRRATPVIREWLADVWDAAIKQRTEGAKIEERCEELAAT